MKRKNGTIRINYYVLIVVVLSFCIIIGKLIYLSKASKIDGKDVQAIAASRKSAKTILTATRGEILSSNGETLAKNVNSYTVIAILSKSYPKPVTDKEYTANVLADYINMSPEYILSLLEYGEKNGAYQVELGPGGRNISEKLKQEIDALDLDGIGFISSTKRYYPYGDFASYIIGYAKKNDAGEIIGELGVESYYNDELTGKNGSISYQQDAYGYRIADTPVITEEAKSGKDIYLSIDSNVQMYLENALEDMRNNYTYEWATVTVANAKTGAILGSASTPSYNPNILNITEWNAPLVSYAYEPGSTMKIFSFMAAIEEGIYDGEAKYMSGSKKIGNYTVNDWNKTGWGEITYDKGFTYSSNVAAINLGLTLGGGKLTEYYKAFGFGQKTGIEMANEYNGVVNPTYEIEVANISFGQGLTSTPIQNIQALTSLANEGTVIKPYIVEKIVDHETGETVYQSERTEVSKPVSKETVNKMLELMYETVNSDDYVATGRVYKTENTTLAGKTGTAQIASSKGGYQTGSYNNIRSFAGVFPYENPEYIIYISVKKLQSSSSAIGKYVKSIVESIAKYKNLSELVVEQDKSMIISLANYINKYTDTSIAELEELGLDVVKIGEGERIIDQYPEKGTNVIKGNKVFIYTNSTNITMPNMIGWSSNDANSYCNLIGLTCTVEGYGKVISQSIEAGEPIASSSLLSITLNRD